MVQFSRVCDRNEVTGAAAARRIRLQHVDRPGLEHAPEVEGLVAVRVRWSVGCAVKAAIVTVAIGRPRVGGTAK